MILKDKSLVLIKTPKTGTESIKKSLSNAANSNGLSVLDLAYDNIYTQKNKKYDMSLNHINYNDKYISHLKNIMNNDLLFISAVRQPITRAVSHYYYSNQYRNNMDFNSFYKKYTVGSVILNSFGRKGVDVINNQMSSYMGYKNISEITEKSINDRYKFVFVLEDFKKSFEVLSNKIGIELIVTHENKNSKKDLKIEKEIEVLFTNKNQMDFKLYDICREILVKQ